MTKYVQNQGIQMQDCCINSHTYKCYFAYIPQFTPCAKPLSTVIKENNMQLSPDRGSTFHRLRQVPQETDGLSTGYLSQKPCQKSQEKIMLQ